LAVDAGDVSVIDLYVSRFYPHQIPVPADAILDPQRAAGQPTGAAGGVALTSTTQLAPIIRAAEANWEAVGIKPSAFKNVQFQIGMIDPGVLGNTAGRVITIDPTADGFGWYINPNDSAFQLASQTGELLAAPGSMAVGHMDLLTVMEHELGHILGLDDVDSGTGLMATTLAAGVRRLPTVATVESIDQVFAALASGKKP